MSPTKGNDELGLNLCDKRAFDAAARMLKGKRRPEKFKEKLDFKFQFHATRVPHSGWEKLYVSLEPTETGKPTAKTAKSLAQNGTCRWPDAIIDSTKLVHETKSNSYDAKFYKFVVGMSSTRILGEVTLNLADYVTATSPTSAALPLKNCSAGTVLHIKVQCLTSAESPREVEQPKDERLSEDDLDDSASQTSLANLPPQTPNSNSVREKSLARYNSDSSDVSTPGGTAPNGSGKGFYVADVPSPTSSVSNFNARLERSNGRRASQDSVKSMVSPARPARTSLPNATRASQEGKAAFDGGMEMIEELRMEAMSWEKNARKLEQDMESLKQQLSEQTNRLSEKDEEVSVLVGERDSLRAEMEELKFSRQASDEERGQREGSLRLELEDCRHLIKELQQVLAYEKEAKANLDAQLKKTQESNMQLVLAVQDLEESSVDQKKEMEQLSSKNTKLESSLIDQEQTMSELEKVFTQKLYSKEQEVKLLEGKYAKLQAVQEANERDALHVDPVELVDLKGEIEELEADIKELTDENMDLIFKLNIANKELSRFSGEFDYLGMNGLEEKLIKFRKEQHNATDKLVMLETSNRELKTAKTDLEIRLRSSLDEIQTLKAELKTSRNIHAMDMEAYTGREKRLKERADEMHEKYAMTFNLVADLESDLETVTKENSENKRRRNELEVAVENLELLKTDLSYRLAELENDNSKARTHARKCESELAERMQELRSKTAKISDFESRILMLEASNDELDTTVRDFHDRDTRSTSRIVDLELQLSSTKRELDSLDFSKHELESRVDDLEIEKYELGNMLQAGQQESRFLKEKLEDIMGELEESKAQLELEQSARANFEKKMVDFGSSKLDLEKQVSHLEEENWHLTERIAGLDAHLNYLTEERETCKLQSSTAESRAMELQREKSEFEAKIQEVSKQYDSKIHGIEVQMSQVFEERDAHMHARKRLEAQVEELRAEIAHHLDCKQLRQGRISELEESCSKLESSLKEARNDCEEFLALRNSLEAKVSRVENELSQAVTRHTEERERLVALRREQENRAKRTEELLQKTQWEKASAVERLQGEVQRLTDQMDATFDEKEHLASQALIEASELRAEKHEWEDSKKQLQERLKQARADGDYIRKQNEGRLQEVLDASKKRELELTLKLEGAVGKLAETEANRKSLSAEYESKLVLSENQRQALLQENAELRNKAAGISVLKAESGVWKETLDKLQFEKGNLEITAQRLDTEKARLEQEKASLEQKLHGLNQSLVDHDQLKVSKTALEEKVHRLESELNAQSATRALESEQRSESMKLRKQNSEMRQRMLEHEEEREELRKKVESLEADLKKRAEALSAAEKRLKERAGADENGKTPTGSGVLARSLSKSNVKVGSREARELHDLRDKIKSLEAELKLKTAESEGLKKDARQKETNLLKKIDSLEAAANPDGSNVDQQQQQNEMMRLQNQVCLLTLREQELLAKLNSNELLQKEMQRFQQVNMQLQEKLAKFKEASQWGNNLERAINLEMELAEALESNNMYKAQLRSAFATQQNVHAAALQNLGDVDQVVSDLLGYKRKSSELEAELSEMRERYLSMSLKFAEVEGEREELVMTVRSLKNGRRFF